MKRIFLLLFTAILITGCSNSGSSSESAPEEAPEISLVSYEFKVDGIQDQAISDSIFYLHFKLQGIDKMIISKKDSTVVITVDPEKLNRDALATAIEDQGGVILNN